VAESYVNDVESRAHHLRLLAEMADEGMSILTSGEDLNRFGKLLDESWQAKRSLGSKVSNAHVEEIYDAALAAGAIGGKLTGAGGGGFLLLFVTPADQPRVRERLGDLLHVPFRFESSGSQIIFFDQEA